ncbi:MAG TPA: DUF6364 family protein [Polyangia bacterium]|jgi:hypothetical protein
MSSTNLTLAVDEGIVARARAVARQQGTSLNALIRGYLEDLAGRRGPGEIYDELARLWAEDAGRSGGYRFRREDVYEGRDGRARLR